MNTVVSELDNTKAPFNSDFTGNPNLQISENGSGKAGIGLAPTIFTTDNYQL